MTLLTHILLFLSITFVVYWFVVPAKWRTASLLLASLYLMALFSVEYTIYFMLNAILVYVASSYLKKSGENNTLLLKLTLIWLIGYLTFFKLGSSLHEYISESGATLMLFQDVTFSKIVVPLGLSYITFRLIHYAVESYSNNLPDHSFVEFALYVFFFPTFLAGPVDRLERFQPQTRGIKNIDVSDTNYGLFRIISGLIKKCIISASLTPIVLPILNAPHEHSGISVLLAIYGFTMALYMDFSGYTDMALGVARLFGYQLMENFNYPFFKKNIAEFIRNWHISIYSFIRDYFFFPFFGYRTSRTKIYFGLFVTMIVFMIWHQFNMSFLTLGIYTGTGLVAWHVLQDIKKKYFRVRKKKDNPVMVAVSTFITFNYVCLGFLLFSYDIFDISIMIKRIFI